MENNSVKFHVEIPVMNCEASACSSKSTPNQPYSRDQTCYDNSMPIIFCLPIRPVTTHYNINIQSTLGSLTYYNLGMVKKCFTWSCLP